MYLPSACSRHLKAHFAFLAPSTHGPSPAAVVALCVAVHYPEIWVFRQNHAASAHKVRRLVNCGHLVVLLEELRTDGRLPLPARSDGRAGLAYLVDLRF
jgi:hypothetical protein